MSASSFNSGTIYATSGNISLESRVTAVGNFPVPTNKFGLQHFLGMINYNRCFMPKLANIHHPLHDATKIKGKVIEWTQEYQSAFLEADLALVSSTFLHHSHSNVKNQHYVGCIGQGSWCEARTVFKHHLVSSGFLLYETH